MLLMWQHMTQWSSGTTPVLYSRRYATPLVTCWTTTSATDLRERFLLLDVFLPDTSSCFLRLPWGRQFNLKLTGLHADPQNIVPARLFVWITTIQKRFICGRFCLRVKGVWPWNIKLYRALILWKISFTETLLLRFTPLTGFELSSQQVIWYKSLVIFTKPWSLANHYINYSEAIQTKKL